MTSHVWIMGTSATGGSASSQADSIEGRAWYPRLTTPAALARSYQARSRTRLFSVTMVRGAGGCCVAMIACLLTCCRGGSSNSGESISVRMEDFRLHAATTTAASGTVTLRLHNDGPSTHEINVDRTDLADDKLPLREDGLSVAEDSPLLKRIGSIEVVEAGDNARLTLDLPPGHYVLYCNLEGHYLGRMYATLDVH